MGATSSRPPRPPKTPTKTVQHALRAGSERCRAHCQPPAHVGPSGCRRQDLSSCVGMRLKTIQRTQIGLQEQNTKLNCACHMGMSCALPWGSRFEGPECNGGSGPPHGMSSGHRMGHLSGQLRSVEATTLGNAYGGRPGLGMAGTLRCVACTPPPQTHTQTVGPDYSTVLDMVSPVGAVGGGGGGGPPCGERLGGRFGNGGERLSPRRGKGGRAPNAFLWVFCWPRP